MVSNVLDEDILSDPYPLYRQWRSEAAVGPVTFPSGLVVWQVTDAEAARSVLADRRFTRALRALQRAGILGMDFGVGASMLTSDPPQHTRLRKLISWAFTPRRIARMRPRIQSTVDRLLDGVADADEVDLVEALTARLPGIVMCDLIGVPEADRPRFGQWTRALVTTATTGQERAARRDAVLAQRQYWQQLVHARSATMDTSLAVDDQPDLLSALLTARGEVRLSEPELLAMLNLLVVAGQETMSSMLGNAVLALLSHPGQLRLLREQPALLPNAVEELLRYDPPVQRCDLQIALEDVTVGGVTIPQGAAVVVVLGAANRDRVRHPEPDRLDIRRGSPDHLAFGHGPHYCLGAQLARLETEVVLGTLFTRFPGITMAGRVDQVPRGPRSLFVRGVTALRVHTAAPKGSDSL
ncbi:cytochrome P450 [Kibdelosporangium persicum]|uniref:Unspecific monooxygenase n=1 Tax=Kibdelosporangium persicum TaxID=2698649 RepID=A0ABX2FF91_9PSEU|nr:cytochrome P450 [Kibdelosporangium persicum]NRN69405.1 Unspecific monooxygenase [Kibdelosporangium persicum]